MTRADGSREKYHYDAYNRNTKIEYFKSGETQPGTVIEYTYMTGSQRLEYEEVTDETGGVNRLAYSYNADGSIMSYSQSLNSEGGLSVGYTYNKNSQVTSVSYAKPNNAGDYSDGLGEYGRQVIWYEYDPDTGFLLRIYKDQTVTDIEPTAKTANAKLVREYFYKDGGSIDYIKDYIDFNTGSSSFTKLEYEYDGFGRVTALTYRDGGGTIKEKFALEYDDLGNIVKETITEAYSGSETKTKHYAYDLASRLISSTEGGTVTSYTYDKAGNRKSVKVGSAAAQNYEYNYLNQLEEISQGASTPIEFTYDQLGNTTKETVGNKTTNYEYNLLNQLTQLEKKTGNTVNLTEEYSYNPQGQRTARITDHHDVGGTDEFTRFYYMGSALLFTTTEGYLLQTENILDLGGQIIAGKRFENVLYSGKYFFYRYDVRGSVTNILGTDGGVVKNYEYDEFGNTTKGGDGSFKNDVTFTGSISDSASGLQYMNARYYNSSTGRFITQDTYTGSVTEPLTQHLYSYCGNNPIKYIDPTGHTWEDFFNGLKTVVVAAVAIAVVVIAAPVVASALAFVTGISAAAATAVTAVAAVTVTTTIATVAVAEVESLSTGKNFVLDALGGNQEAYDWIKTIAYLGAGMFGAIADAYTTLFGSPQKQPEPDETDYYVTPKGDAIPGKQEDFYDNLSKMQNNGGNKYTGQNSNGVPVRTRVEGAHPETNNSASPSPYHVVPHIHVEYKQNIYTGDWGKGLGNKFTLPQSRLK